MPRELIGASDIIIGAWENLKKHFPHYTGYIVWFVALSLLQWVLLITTRNLIADPVMRTLTYGFATIPISLFIAVVGIAMVHMTAEGLQGRRPDSRASFNHALHRFIPFLWVSILTGILLLFGFIVLIIPFLYLSIALKFSTAFVVVDDVRGTAAIRASRDLVRGRWWATLWRTAVPGLFFYFTAAFLLSLTYLVIGAFFGDPALFFQEGTGALEQLTNSQLLVTTVVPQAVNGLVLPLFLASDLLLWYSLKESA